MAKTGLGRWHNARRKGSAAFDPPKTITTSTAQPRPGICNANCRAATTSRSKTQGSERTTV
jgi:hypothetical protein